MPNRSSSSRDLSERWRFLLQAIAATVAIEIALHSFIVKEPVLTLVGATLWLGGSFWTRHGGKGGPVLIGAIALFEIVATLFFSEEFAAESHVATWILAVHLLLVGAALLTVVMTITREGSLIPPQSVSS
jgi:uncharacterized membrane protein HdeD (DUF308 family)